MKFAEIADIGPNSVSYTDDDAAVLQRYLYEVRPYNAYGSGYSGVSDIIHDGVYLMDFPDANLKRVIMATAAAENWTYAHQFISLSGAGEGIGSLAGLQSLCESPKR